MSKVLTNPDSIFQSFENQRIMVVGDVMVDRYISGFTSRISPEAPVPIVEILEEDNRLGGAANVALNLQALGAIPILCGVIGKDADGQTLLDKMEAHDLDCEGVMSSSDRITTVKTRIISGKQQLIRLDKENTHELTKSESSQFLKRALELLERKSITGLIFQDYNKGVLTVEVIRTLISACKSLHIQVSVDPKFRNFWNYPHVDLFKPNLKEVCDAVQMKVNPNLHNLKTASDIIKGKLNCTITLITLSELGVFLDDGHDTQIFPTKPRNVADVCGAGDTVISIAALALGAGLPSNEIALLANLAGGQVVEKNGVVTVNKAQLRRELLQILLEV
ncbi:MAG: carbohydrate kinase [Bacteroidetes bacterium]|nr:carbohydrate kinase [Bacteroidota bacterium]